MGLLSLFGEVAIIRFCLHDCVATCRLRIPEDGVSYTHVGLTDEV